MLGWTLGRLYSPAHFTENEMSAHSRDRRLKRLESSYFPHLMQRISLLTHLTSTNHVSSISPSSLHWPIASHLYLFHVIIIIHQGGGVWHFIHRLNILESPLIIKQEHAEVFLSRHQLSRLCPSGALANSAACVHALTCLLTWLTFQPINDRGSEGKRFETGEQAVSQRGAKQLVEPITPVSC